jgi:plastocyanin
MSRKHKLRNEEYRDAPQSSSSGAIKYIAAAIAVIILVFGAAELILGRATAQSDAYAQQPLAAGLTGAAQPSAGASPTVGADGIQEVQVSMNGYWYQPDPIRLKVGVPARLVIDLSTVTGCMRTIEIPDLGVSKYVSQGDNVITFTPTKAGTFSMHCGMNMGQGVVVVEDAEGNVPAGGANLAASAPAAGGACGASGGGCGCGGR